jgi:hypothetical protein
MTEMETVLLTGFIAAAVAMWGVLSQRVITRRRATLELIVKVEADHDYIEAHRCFVRLAKTPEGLAPWAAAGREESKELHSVRLVLNNYELISIEDTARHPRLRAFQKMA